MKIIEFIKNNKIVIGYWFWIIITLLFLSSIDWVWCYLDNRWLLWKFKDWTFGSSFYSILNSSTLFWYDSSVLDSSRLLWKQLVQNINQFVLYFIYLFSSFYFAYKLLRIKYKFKPAIFGAIFFSINPVSIHLMWEVWYMFSYISLPIIVYSLYRLYNFEDNSYLFLFALGEVLFISYTRITGLYFTLFLLLSLFFYKKIYNLFFFKRQLLFKLIFISFIIYLPFLFSLIYPNINGDTELFSWIWNYTKDSLSYSKNYYFYLRDNDFIKSLYVSGFIPNFDWLFQKTFFFKIFGIFYFLYILSLALYFNLINKDKNIENKFIYYISFLLILFIIFFNSASFISLNKFTIIFYKYYPFLTNNFKWLYIVYIPLLTILLTFIFDQIKNKYLKNLNYILLLCFLLLSLIPFIFFQINEKVSLVKEEQIPVTYKEVFFIDKWIREWTLFFPSTKLLYLWNNYPLDITWWNYKKILSSNPRYINQKQSFINNQIANNVFNFNNILFFNLKNIFLFKDITVSDYKQFDYYDKINTKVKENLDFRKIDNNIYLEKVIDNSRYNKYRAKDSNNYEFFIYSPWKIIKEQINLFFNNYSQKLFNIFDKPLVLDDNSFNKPLFLNDFKIPEENKNIFINYKTSLNNREKHYLKVSNFDWLEPFLIQLNLTYWNDWELRFINQKEYEKTKCINWKKDFIITQNSYCYYNQKYFWLTDIKYLFNLKINNENHFEWNFIWNTWYIDPKKYIEKISKDQELYFVIIYKKQIFYTYLLFISISLFLILFIYFIFCKIKYINNMYSNLKIKK